MFNVPKNKQTKKVQLGSSLPLGDLKDPVKSQSNASADPEERELRLRPTRYLPERFPPPPPPPPSTFAALRANWAPSTWIVQQCSRLGFFYFFTLRLRLTSHRGLVHIQIALDQRRDYYSCTAYLLKTPNITDLVLHKNIWLFFSLKKEGNRLQRP